MTTKAPAVYFSRGAVVRVVASRNQGFLRNRVGTVRDSTRSLATSHERVYFVYFADMGISAWLAEDQLSLEAEQGGAA